ncbi:uncharacterized protein BO97DRAFT_442233 [Aspergillus homomorphus CBS 101889]|uniref:Uncharacterized protein n=1 Tax=Aspergillus homomorphus (strain CBS 101889) TaxID=1450537 RepID=A0A395I1P9_ASPHC|nr:hypothetical protein BO97DRAFT_442233 [Aspergillus homomorphus CBS 101889]RAL13563.1 hypothetical protein BO97DRAFT_442233 [Aspergillus homomorphus CBS 101889]
MSQSYWSPVVRLGGLPIQRLAILFPLSFSPPLLPSSDQVGTPHTTIRDIHHAFEAVSYQTTVPRSFSRGPIGDHGLHYLRPEGPFLIAVT